MTTDNATMGADISAALVKAQEISKAVGKDGTNKYHQYKYASAEAMIEEARTALTAAGLALFQAGFRFVESSLPRADKLPVGRVYVRYRLVHTTGQFYEFESSTSVIPEKGRPDDKAEFGAITANLGYTLRGLLLLPREDAETSPDARNDLTYTPPVAAPPPPVVLPTPAPAPPAAAVSRSAPVVSLPSSAPPAAPAAAPPPATDVAEYVAVVVELQRLINSAKTLEDLAPNYEGIRVITAPKTIKDPLFASLFGTAFKLAANRAELDAWAPAVKASKIEGESQAWTRAEWERRYNELPS